MTLALDSADLKRLAQAHRVLLSPSDFGSADEWCRTVNRDLRKLLDADMATFVLPAEDGISLISDEIPAEVLEQFPARIEPLDARWSLFDKAVDLGAFSREQLFHLHRKEFFRSTYYNEYIVPNRLHDSLSLATSLGEAPHPKQVAALVFHHEQPSGRRFGTRGLEILRLLLPSFSAGVRSYHHRIRQHVDLLQTLATLDEGLLFCDTSGNVLYRTPMLSTILADDPQSDLLMCEMTRVAAGLWATEVMHGDSERRPIPEVLVREVRTRANRYRMRVSRLRGDLFGQKQTTLVILKRIRSRIPSIETIRERFALSKQEAHVMVLLAEGKSNAEVAAALRISPHTARHHTEHVLERLGVNSRAQVASHLYADEGDDRTR